ncbi:hypothetical protein SBA2_450081 [Acidobacteriia bacterium SbA2]|nr:hypothetical protein SBA2_450081 [Acidobacteriia bacterium SbA2]
MRVWPAFGGDKTPFSACSAPKDFDTESAEALSALRVNAFPTAEHTEKIRRGPNNITIDSTADESGQLEEG